MQQQAGFMQRLQHAVSAGDAAGSGWGVDERDVRVQLGEALQAV